MDSFIQNSCFCLLYYSFPFYWYRSFSLVGAISIWAKNQRIKTFSLICNLILSFTGAETYVYFSDEKKGSLPKVVVEDSKSLELNITSNEPVQIQVRKTARHLYKKKIYRKFFLRN